MTHYKIKSFCKNQKQNQKKKITNKKQKNNKQTKTLFIKKIQSFLCLQSHVDFDFLLRLISFKSISYVE